MGWHITCEKLLSVSIPKRVDYLRVIIMELARISDHLVCNSILGVDTGAFTGFLFGIPKALQRAPKTRPRDRFAAAHISVSSEKYAAASATTWVPCSEVRTAAFA